MQQITICICTLDRASELSDCFGALLQNKGLEFTEILVVNNGAGEATREVVENFAQRLPVRYIRHEKPSVGEALNRAWQEAACDWLAYIDDDSVVYESWLPALLEDIHIVRPDCFAIAGNIDMGPESLELPEWCHPQLAAAAYSNKNFGDHAHYLEYPDAPVGNNFIIRKTHLAQNGGFALGLRTYWENHIITLGYWSGGSCYFDPRIRVAHRPSANRLNIGWALNKLHYSGMDYQDMVGRLRYRPNCPPRYDFLFKLPLLFFKMIAAYLMFRRKHVFVFYACLLFEWGRFEKQFFLRNTIEYSTFNSK